MATKRALNVVGSILVTFTCPPDRESWANREIFEEIYFSSIAEMLDKFYTRYTKLDAFLFNLERYCVDNMYAYGGNQTASVLRDVSDKRGGWEVNPEYLYGINWILNQHLREKGALD